MQQQRLRLIPVILLLALLSQAFGALGASAATGGPVAVTLQPADNNPVVPANTQLSIVFDEPVFRGSGGSVLIKEVATNNTVANYDVATSSQIQISPNNKVNIQPPANTLQANIDYYVQVTPGAFTSASGYFAGITDATAWNFHVVPADMSPPSVVTFNTASTGSIPATGALSITFNEPVQAASGSIQIVRRDTQDPQVISVLSSAVTGSGTNVIRIQPPTRLAAGTQYDVLIDSGAFVDAVGNPFAGITGPYIWSFSTAVSAVAAPQLVQPANGASGVSGDSPITLLLQFQTGMKAGASGNITVKRVSNNETVEMVSAASGRISVSGGKVSIPLYNTLARNTSYYVLIDPGALLTAGGESYEGIVDPSVWRFTTAASVDTTRPVVVSTAPAAGGTTTDLTGALSIQFDEPVVPGSGNVVIRNADTNTVFCSIPVASPAVTGGGTATISIKPCASFAPNTSYAVQIGTMAFADMSGNYYLGIGTADYNTWRFRVASDTTPPELVSTDPAPLLTSVRKNAVLRMNFNEPVRLGPSAATASAILVGSSGGTRIPLTLAVDSSDPRIVTLTPDSEFAAASGYIVNVPASTISDLAGNAYPGILNDYRWTFQTIGTDTTPPALSGAAMDSAAIVLLTYNEALDEVSIPYASNYYVTVNDVPRQVNAIAVKGNQVRLTLQSGVAVGQAVKVSYTLGAVKLKDLSGNEAAALSATNVANTADTTLPRPTSGVISGSTLTLTFSKTLASVPASAASQFTVKVNGSAQSISSISSSGASVTIGLYTTIGSSQSVSVSYTPGSVKLADLSGNETAAFSDFYIQNASDTTPPSLTGVSVLGNIVVLTYNEGLLASSVPPKSSFSVLVGGSAAEISAVALSNNAVTLTLASTVMPNQTVTVTYIPGATPIKDLSGNQAMLFTGYSVTAGSTATATLSGISVSGTAVTLQYSAALNASTAPYPAQYTVKNADGGLFGISGVRVSGSQVVLTLTAPIEPGKSVTVSYTTAGNALKDAAGNTIASFGDTSASNQTSAAAGLPDYLTLDGAGGLLLSQSAAAKVPSGTPSGKAASRYNLDRDRVTMAYSSLEAAQAAGTARLPQISFSVPQSEAGAIVAIPVVALAGAVQRDASAIFRLDYGDLLFSLPLKALNYSQQVQASGGDISTAYLVLKIEKLSNTALASALNNKGITAVSPASDFSASIEVGGTERQIDEYGTYVTRTFLLPAASASAADATVVRLDGDSGEIVYVPTEVSVSGSTLRVDFKRKSNSIYAVIAKPAATFSDMTKHWAGADVASLAAKFVVKGSSSTAFAPERKITRAEFAEFIVRGLGLSGSAASAARFSDVGAGGTAAAYIGAAAKAGIVQGGTDGLFRPGATITREEMATMMLRAMSYTGVMPTVTGSELAPFTDRAKVSSWAKDAVVVAVKTGLIKGVSATQLMPKDNATRAQAAVIVKRFLEFVELM